jgi:hypothetical protein
LVSYFGLELSDTLVHHLGDIGCGYSIDGYWSDMWSKAIFNPYDSNYPVVELQFDVFVYGVVALDLIIKDWEKTMQNRLYAEIASKLVAFDELNNLLGEETNEYKKVVQQLMDLKTKDLPTLLEKKQIKPNYVKFHGRYGQ